MENLLKAEFMKERSVTMRKIRVMIVDDTLVFRSFLTATLSADPEMQIVGSFAGAGEALERISILKPDVMTVDMEMPKMSGDEFMKIALPRHPNLKAVVVSSISNKVFDAMQAGAIDFVAKPGFRPGYDNQHFAKEIIEKIKIAAAARVQTAEGAGSARTVAAAQKPPPVRPALHCSTARSIIAIGASTGGTEAILEVIKRFPKSAPATVVVQHMPEGFTSMYAQRANGICDMEVREAKNGDRAEKGVVLIAPGGNNQLQVKKDMGGYHIHLAPTGKVSGHCPSVDVMFNSVAEAGGKDAVGVLLTGMGSDGANGLHAMKRAGAFTIGQDEKSSVIYGMPKVAFDIGAVTQQLPLQSIGEAVLKRFY